MGLTSGKSRAMRCRSAGIRSESTGSEQVSGLDLEVTADQVAGQIVGEDVESQHPSASQSGEHPLAPVQEVGGGRSLIERRSLVLRLVSQREEIMIAEEDSQGQVPAGQVAQVFRDDLGIDLVEQVREQNNQRTFPAPLLELHERPIIPRLDRFG